MRSDVRDAAATWRQTAIPVVYRPGDAPLLVKLPFAVDNADWLHEKCAPACWNAKGARRRSAHGGNADDLATISGRTGADWAQFSSAVAAMHERPGPTAIAICNGRRARTIVGRALGAISRGPRLAEARRAIRTSQVTACLGWRRRAAQAAAARIAGARLSETEFGTIVICVATTATAITTVRDIAVNCGLKLRGIRAGPWVNVGARHGEKAPQGQRRPATKHMLTDRDNCHCRSSLRSCGSGARSRIGALATTVPGTPDWSA